jgi:hypothetical protein
MIEIDVLCQRWTLGEKKRNEPLKASFLLSSLATFLMTYVRRIYGKSYYKIYRGQSC